MPEGFAEWLRRSLSRRGWSQGQLAIKIGVSPATVSRWLSGGRPDPEYAGRLATAFSEPLQKVYALAGHPANYEPPTPLELSPQEQILEALSELPVAVPVIEQYASAGGGQVVQDRIWIDKPRAAGKNLRAVPVRGQSMEPEIRDGDTVIIDTDATAADGDLVVASVGDEIYVKRLSRKSDHFILVGNDSVVIPVEDTAIAGKVIQIIRDVA